jgi:hypothetical protein
VADRMCAQASGFEESMKFKKLTNAQRSGLNQIPNRRCVAGSVSVSVWLCLTSGWGVQVHAVVEPDNQPRERVRGLPGAAGPHGHLHARQGAHRSLPTECCGGV